jgi:transglutaminase-like putative cysteine protease
MQLTISTTLAWQLNGPTDLLLQIEAAAADPHDQCVHDARLDCSPTAHFARVPALDGVGERIWLHHEGGSFSAEYSARVDVLRPVVDLMTLQALPPYRLPGEAVPYLMDSRYCPANRFAPFVTDEFAELEGGPKVAAMRDWISRHYRYVAGASNATTDAIDSFVERRGVCRDYAHTLICLARAAAIPARFASGYGPKVKPQDFHAVAEVWLADAQGRGGWHIVDATGMADPQGFARIAVGRDAGDASFLTSYGSAWLSQININVAEVLPGG